MGPGDALAEAATEDPLPGLKQRRYPLTSFLVVGTMEEADVVGAGVGGVPRKPLSLCALLPVPWLVVGLGSQGSVPVRRGQRVGSR